MGDLMTQVTSQFPTVLGWFGDAVSAMATTEGELSALLPFLALGLIVTILFAGVKMVRSFLWGGG